MANAYCRATTTWTGTIWSGTNPWYDAPSGGSPVTPDGTSTLVANSYTVTISANLTVVALTNDNRGGATAGGKFTCATDGLVIAANIFAGSTTTPCFQSTIDSGNSITILGTVTGGTGASASYGVQSSLAGTVNIGSAEVPTTITGGIGAQTSYGVYNSSTGIINVVGNVVGGSGNATATGMGNSNTGVINVTGNVTGGSGANTSYGITNSSTGVINVTGNVTGGSGGTTSHGINNTASGTINVTGTAGVTGGSSAAIGACYGINGTIGTVNIGTGESPGSVTGGPGSVNNHGITTTSGYVNIYGPVTGGTSTGISAGVFNSIAGVVTIVGTLTATASSPAIASSTTGALFKITGNMIGHASGMQANAAARWHYNAASVPVGSYIRVSADGASTVEDMIPTGASYNDQTRPVITRADVKAAVWDTLTTALTTSGSIGERLKNCATVASTGDQLAAFEVADPWLTPVPGAYADGTAAAALGRLNLTAADAPVLVVPDPADDSTLATVYIYTEDITGSKVAGITVHFQLVNSPAKSSKVLLSQSISITTDANGYAATSLRRNDAISPAGSNYLVTCNELGFFAVELDLAADLFNLASLIP